MAQHFDALPRRAVTRGGLALLLVAALAGASAAQVPPEASGGTRALGMGGAFTAVADDASATWWNPAALPTLLADAVIDGGAQSLIDDPARPIDGEGAWRASPFSVAVAVPMMGISYNHLALKEIRSSATAAPGLGRQDPATTPRVRSLDTNGVGLTLAQSLGDWIVVGGTVRLLHATAAAATVSADTTADAALDAAGTLDGPGRTVVDGDLGALAFAGPVRLALVVRNVGGYEFETGLAGDEPFRLDRQVRIGVAFGRGPAWIRRDWTVSADADLTTTEAADGARRTLAVGGERWFGAKRFAVRAGGRMQTVGDARPEASGGGSVAVATGVYVEGQVSGGGDRAVSGWSLAARVTF